MNVNVGELHEAMQNEGWLIQRRGKEVLLVDSQEVIGTICTIEVELFNELEKSLIKRVGTIIKAAGVYDVYIPVGVFEVEAVDEKEEPGEDEKKPGEEKGEEKEKDLREEPTGEEKGIISRVKDKVFG